MNPITEDQIQKYSSSLKKHLEFVYIAGGKLGLSPGHLELHDLSKLSDEEFLHFVRQYAGDKDDPQGYAYAWLHHIHNNPHHWQYWMFNDNYKPKGVDIGGNGQIEMPPTYCVEMIADWYGASMAYTGSWDMTDWLYKNFGRVILHERSSGFVIDLLSDLGYYRILLELGFCPRLNDMIALSDPNEFESMVPMARNWWEMR